MKKLSPKQMLTVVKSGIRKHSPEILTGIGITGTLVAIGMAVKATPKALILIEDEKEDLDKDELTVVETVKMTWKCYIPATVTEGLSIACLIGASRINFRRNAALAAAYALSETAMSEYQTKVVETIGEKKEKQVRDAIAQDLVEKHPIGENEVVITAKGDTLCYDAISGRYFRSDRDKIDKVVNELNRRMRDEMYISLNDFYYEIGLRPIDLGDELGWNIERGYIEPSYSYQGAEDGSPCMVISYMVEPRYDYCLVYDR